MRGANFLVHVDAFAVLGHAIGQLARAPVLGLFDLAALFRAGVLDRSQNLLDLVFRRRWPCDENQIVQTLFHGYLVFLSPPDARSGKIVQPSVSGSPSSAARRLNLFIAASMQWAMI